VVAEIVLLEDGAAVLGDPFGRKPIRVWVNRGYPPAVAVADLIDAVTGLTGVHVDGDVVASAHDDVADPDLLIARGRHGWPRTSEGVVQANATEELYRDAEKDRLAFWAKQANRLFWDIPFDEVLDWSGAPFAKWFVGGKLSVAYKCVDRACGGGQRRPCRNRMGGRPRPVRPSLHTVGRPRGGRPRTALTERSSSRPRRRPLISNSTSDKFSKTVVLVVSDEVTAGISGSRSSQESAVE
jgi:Acetyl-coenzyme A synthetase N-terminus